MRGEIFKKRAKYQKVVLSSQKCVLTYEKNNVIILIETFSIL